MVERPLHAVVLPVTEAGGQLLELLAAALDGTGPAVLPLDPELPADRLAAILDAFAPAAVHTPDGVTRRAESRPAEPDTAVVIATSGSTGQPKGVELSAAALRHSARATLDRVGATAGQRWLLCLPATHIAGIQVLIRSLVAGTDPVVVTRADADVLAGSGCAHVSIVPTQLRRLLDADPDAAWARGFTSVLLGGAAAPAALVDGARAAGVPVITTYGMSETCGGCVYDGQPLAGVTVTTADPAGHAAGDTDGGRAGGAAGDGRIRISGPVLFSGYRGRPDLTAAAMDGAWFVTSDLGLIGTDGRLAVRGRADDVIITGGEKVVAGEVAALLETCPGVREAAVVGRPDAEWGERVTAVIVPDNPAQPPTLDLLCRHVQERLPRYALPRELVLRAAMPMLPSGKPDLETLRREQSPAANVSR